MDATKPLGLAWDSALCLQAARDRRSLAFLDLSALEFAHELRSEARQLLWQRAGCRRGDMAGLQAGVDVEASCQLLRKHGNAAVHKGLLRTVLSGAVIAGHRASKF